MPNLPDGCSVQDLSVIFATPTLGTYADEFLHSNRGTMMLLGRHGIPFGFIETRQKTFMGVARDQLATAFLTKMTDAQNLFFIDDDVGWPPEKVLEFLFAPEPIIAGIPPLKKEPLLERIKDAIASFDRDYDNNCIDHGALAGFYDQIKELEAGAMEFPWNPVRNADGTVARNGRGMLLANMVPFGFVRIKRAALERIAEMSPQYKEQGINATSTDSLFALFPDGPDEDFIHRGEDFAFCRGAEHFGVPIAVDPDIEFGHRGSHVFRGKLADTLR